MNRNLMRIATAVVAAAALSSCHTAKLGYFEDTNNAPNGTIAIRPAQLKIEPADELMINVTSELPQETSIYNLPFNVPGLTSDIISNNTPTEKQTYIVSKDGYINFPVFGRLHVAGMTTLELAADLEKRISADVANPLVRVELVNFKVNVMGEVAKPGSYRFDTERVTIMDALATAGDMTIFGKRDNVTVYREKDGKVTYQKLDLNDSKSIESPYYYLQQNDVVYVEPGSSRSGQAEYNQNNSYKISVISTIVSSISVLASLIIALTR